MLSFATSSSIFSHPLADKQDIRVAFPCHVDLLLWDFMSCSSLSWGWDLFLAVYKHVVCWLSGTAFLYAYLLCNASISFCTSCCYWNNLLIWKARWETQACKFLVFISPFIQGVLCGCHWHFCSTKTRGAIWVPEQKELMLFQVHKISVRGWKLWHKTCQTHTPWSSSWTRCDNLQHPRQPCVAMVKLAGLHPQSKTWKRQDFVSIKLRFYYFTHNCSLPMFSHISPHSLDCSSGYFLT